MFDCACASAQSSTVLSRLNSSEASTMTSAAFSAGLARCRDCVSRWRCASVPSSVSASCSRSCDWRRRPEAKRAICWPVMPAWRLLDLVAQGAAGAVDLAAGDEGVDALQCRGQRRGGGGADLGDEAMPALRGLAAVVGGQGRGGNVRSPRSRGDDVGHVHERSREFGARSCAVARGRPDSALPGCANVTAGSQHAGGARCGDLLARPVRLRAAPVGAEQRRSGGCRYLHLAWPRTSSG